MRLRKTQVDFRNRQIIKTNELYGNHEIWIKINNSNLDINLNEKYILSLIENAEFNGLLNKKSTIIVAVTGNIGVLISKVALIKGYKLILAMPESTSSISIEQHEIIISYCAQIILTPREKGIKGAIELTNHLSQEIPDSWVLSNFEAFTNPNPNVDILISEIKDDFPDGLDYIILEENKNINVIAREIKKNFSNTKVISVEVDMSCSLNEYEHTTSYSLKKIENKLVSLGKSSCFFDKTVKIEKNEAYQYALQTIKKENFFVSISTGAVLAALDKYLPEIAMKKRILIIKWKKRRRYSNYCY